MGMVEVHYRVPDVTCAHCVETISGEMRKVPGVADVAVDIDAKIVTVRGEGLDDASLRAAIDAAGYTIGG